MANVVEVIFRGVDQISRNTDQINRSMDAMARTARFAAGALAGVFVADKLIDGVKRFREAADTMALIENRLRLVTDSTGELNAVQDRLLTLANDTRTSFASTVELYARVARSSDELGLSQERLISLTRTINEAIQISGATAQEAAAGVIQFAQGLASGRLSGDELRSVLEQMPRLAKAIAEGMGVSIGQLRELGAEGQLTAQRIIQALESQADTIRTEFSQVESTISGALTGIGNAFLALVGRIDEATGASELLISSLEAIADFVTDLATEDYEEVFNDLVETLQEIERVERAIQGTSGTQQLGLQNRLKALRQEEEELAAKLEELRRGFDDAADGAGNLAEQTQEATKAATSMLEKLQLQAATLGLTAREATLYELKMKGATEAQLAAARAALDTIDAFNRQREAMEHASRALPEDGVGPVPDVEPGLDEMANMSRAALLAMGKNFEDTAKQASTAWDQAIRNIQDVVAEQLFEGFDEGLDGMLKSFIDVVRKMIAQALAAKLVEKLFGKQGEGGGKANFLGDIFGVLVGAGKATGGFTTPGMLHPVNEREPEFLLTPQRSEVIPLSKAAAQGLVGRGGAPVMFNTTNNITTSVSPLELEAALARHDDMLLARFKQWQLDGGMT